MTQVCNVFAQRLQLFSRWRERFFVRVEQRLLRGVRISAMKRIT